MGETATRIRLCAKGEVADGAVLRVETGDLTLAVYNVAGLYYVTDDHCTHGPGSLSEGYLEGHRIECDFHHGAFDIRTGEVSGSALHGAGEDLSRCGRRRRCADRSLAGAQLTRRAPAAPKSEISAQQRNAGQRHGAAAGLQSEP